MEAKVKASNLRIGNLVHWNGAAKGLVVVDVIVGVLAEIENGGNSYSGIPITEEWLLRLPPNLKYPDWIKAVHELQNWYYYNNEKIEIELT